MNLNLHQKSSEYATLKSESWSQFFGLQPKTGVKIQHFDPNTTWGKITTRFCNSNFGTRIAKWRYGDPGFKEMSSAEKTKICDALNKQFNKRFDQDLQEHPDLKMDLEMDPEEFHANPDDSDEFSTDPESGNTSLLLQSIESLNQDETKQNKELKVKSQNWSEFFGLKTKTGVTTRMFGSNTTWGKITALFCLDSTNRVKNMVVNEFKQQCREGTDALSEDSLKGKLTPAAVINLVTTENVGVQHSGTEAV